MVFNSVSVGAAVTPTAVETYLSHASSEARSRFNRTLGLPWAVSQPEAASAKAYRPYFLP